MNKAHALNRATLPIGLKAASEHRELCELLPKRENLSRLFRLFLAPFSRHPFSECSGKEREPQRVESEP